MIKAELKISNIQQSFFNLEIELDLFNKQIQGVYFWKLVRFNLFNQVAAKYGLYEQAHQDNSKTVLQKILSVPSKIYTTYRHGFTTRTKPVDILVFEHPRKVQVDGQYSCVYTPSLVDQLKQQNASYEIVDKEYLGAHYQQPDLVRSYAEHFTLSFFIKRYLHNYSLTEIDIALIDSIGSRLEQLFKVKLDLKKLVNLSIRNFMINKGLYLSALKKRNVKQVYLVVYYGYEPLIAACNELGIKVIELQHGTMSKFHMAYSFPSEVKIPYFPDKVHFFGKYWFDSTPLPITEKQAEFVGYPYLEKQLKSYSHLEKKDNTIVFLSQGSIGRRLADYALSFAKQNPEQIFFYKLHPGEFGRWRKNYDSLLEAEKLPNFKVIEKEKNLYELLAISELAIGVYSTAVYEALASNCMLVLVDLPGVEYCEYLYDNQLAKLVGFDNFDLDKLEFKKLHQKEHFKGYFFKETESIE